MRVKGDGNNRISVVFDNKARLVGLPANETTIRGFSKVSLLLVDEAARVKEELYRAVSPMLAVSRGALWLMSTPFGSRGYFWEAWTRGGPEWDRVRGPATECSRIQADHLEEARRTMGERYFRQEYLCEFEDSVCQVFDRELIERAFTDEFEPLRF
jgi:hypothetical protein